MRKLSGFIVLMATALSVACSPKNNVELAQLPNGAVASFNQDELGFWTISFGKNEKTDIQINEPVQLELQLPDGDRKQIALGYKHLSKRGKNYVASTTFVVEGAEFTITDKWTAEGGIVSLDRKAEVAGNVEGAGFATAVNFVTSEGTSWEDMSFLAPGLLYGDSSYDGTMSPGGTYFDAAKVFTFREDFLPSPMYGMRFNEGETFMMLNAAPDATTTLEETQLGMGESTLISEKFALGAFSSTELEGGKVQIGYCFPNTAAVFQRNRPAPGEAPAEPKMVWARRFNPVNDGFKHHYSLAFRFAADESFPEFTINTYRWAWTVLKPELFWHDIEVVRTSLSDQLSSLVTTMEDRTGLPYQVYTKSGKVWNHPTDPAFYWRDPLGFVGKHIESAVMLLMEGDRDKSERGQRMREQGLAMIETAIKYIPTKNPVCMGFNLMDGTHSMTNLPIWYVREGTDDMVRLLEAYEREKAKGIDHPHWVTWCQDFADWLLKLQREDGSLPRSFMIETAEIREQSGTTSYNIIPTFVKLTNILGDEKYLNAAVKAADYVWEEFGKRGVFIGGAIDNPNITDKEAGLLSAEAFMFLYEKTGEDKWLERAKVAADFAETWTWIWNVPMPEDADDELLNWKKGVPTVGVQGITAQVAGHTDQFLDMSIPTYAKLYKYTGDRHYFDFAKLLMHNCKAMLALPGRLYGMYAPGYQTENFRMGADRQGRGFGTPEKWMPWVTTNHLFGINMMEEYDKEMFDKLCAE